ncbi:mannosyl-glycoprotein endo-beta-N-acetylglucosamidase, partial [Bifidobacterium pseudocatenulatum]|nr:mannosyl-glycoprotein endo-beta-N-acetylglucosamidase [Bifidobacterium pseudocatenulatum]
MKFRSFLLSTIILGSLVVTNATVLAEEIGSSTSETTEVNQMNEVQTTETSASVLTQTTEA